MTSNRFNSISFNEIEFSLLNEPSKKYYVPYQDPMDTGKILDVEVICTAITYRDQIIGIRRIMSQAPWGEDHIYLPFRCIWRSKEELNIARKIDIKLVLLVATCVNPKHNKLGRLHRGKKNNWKSINKEIDKYNPDREQSPNLQSSSRQLPTSTIKSLQPQQTSQNSSQNQKTTKLNPSRNIHITRHESNNMNSNEQSQEVAVSKKAPFILKKGLSQDQDLAKTKAANTKSSKLKKTTHDEIPKVVKKNSSKTHISLNIVSQDSLNSKAILKSKSKSKFKPPTKVMSTPKVRKSSSNNKSKDKSKSKTSLEEMDGVEDVLKVSNQFKGEESEQERIENLSLQKTSLQEDNSLTITSSRILRSNHRILPTSGPSDSDIESVDKVEKRKILSSSAEKMRKRAKLLESPPSTQSSVQHQGLPSKPSAFNENSDSSEPSKKESIIKRTNLKYTCLDSQSSLGSGSKNKKYVKNKEEQRKSEGKSKNPANLLSTLNTHEGSPKQNGSNAIPHLPPQNADVDDFQELEMDANQKPISATKTMSIKRGRYAIDVESTPEMSLVRASPCASPGASDGITLVESSTKLSKKPLKLKKKPDDETEKRDTDLKYCKGYTAEFWNTGKTDCYQNQMNLCNKEDKFTVVNFDVKKGLKFVPQIQTPSNTDGPISGMRKGLERRALNISRLNTEDSMYIVHEILYSLTGTGLMFELADFKLNSQRLYNLFLFECAPPSHRFFTSHDYQVAIVSVPVSSEDIEYYEAVEALRHANYLEIQQQQISVAEDGAPLPVFKPFVVDFDRKKNNLENLICPLCPYDAKCRFPVPDFNGRLLNPHYRAAQATFNNHMNTVHVATAPTFICPAPKCFFICKYKDLFTKHLSTHKGSTFDSKTFEPIRTIKKEWILSRATGEPQNKIRNIIRPLTSTEATLLGIIGEEFPDTISLPLVGSTFVGSTVSALPVLPPPARPASQLLIASASTHK